MPDDQSPGLPQPNDPNSPALGGSRRVLHLVEQLQSEDDKTRHRAMFQLADLGDERAITHLKDLGLSTRKDLVGKRVIVSLCTLPNTHNELTAIAVRGRTPVIREYAAAQLYRRPPEPVIAGLRAALFGSDPAQHLTAADAFRRIYDEHAIPTLIEGIERPDLRHSVHTLLIHALGNHRTQAVFDYLSEWPMGGLFARRRTADALWKQNMPGASEVLFERLPRETIPAIRADIIMPLCHIGTREMVESLFDEAADLLTDFDGTADGYDLQDGAVEVLCALGTPEALEILVRHGVTHYADTLLGEIGMALRGSLTDELRGILRHALTDPDEVYMHCVFRLLQVAADPAFVPDMLAILEGDNVQHQSYAADVLDTIDDPAAIPTMQTLIDHPSHIAPTARGFLVRHGVDISDHLWQLIDEADEDEQRNLIEETFKELAMLGVDPERLMHYTHGLRAYYALRVLHHYDDPAVWAHLRHCLQDNHLHSAAAWSLTRLGDPAGFDALIRNGVGASSLCEALATAPPHAKSLAYLRHQAVYSTYEHVRPKAIETLAHLAQQDAANLLRGEVRRHADLRHLTPAIRALHTPNARPLLLDLLGAHHAALRLAAVEALASFPPDPAIREALAHLLTWEPQYRVRRAAEAVLAQ